MSTSVTGAFYLPACYDSLVQDSGNRESASASESANAPTPPRSARSAENKQENDPSSRNRRQPMSGNDAYWLTQEAYSKSSTRSEDPGPEILQYFGNACAGLTTEAMRRVADGQASSLEEALRQIRADVADPNTKAQTTSRIQQLQSANQYNPDTPMQGYSRRKGNYLKSSSKLKSDLAQEYGKRHTTNDGSGTQQTTFMQLGLVYRDHTGHAVMLQRLHPSDDYRNDEYELYDPNFGVLHYRNFEGLCTALNSLYANGYRDHDGIEGIRTCYFSDSRTYRAYPTSRPRSNLWNRLLSSLSRSRDGQQGAPSSAQLPPAPDFDQPGPSGRQGHPELKRDLKGKEGDRRPHALYRPSTVSPEELKPRGGFSAADVLLSDVSLDTHDDDVQYGKANVDGAGYLGTFRGEDTAKQKLDAGKQDGYVYYVAPGPNMVDVNGSLGTRSRDPNNQEVAAMGDIPYTQIRGWQKVHDGKVGPYEANPDYRWDIYDQTKTAGAQPQLAGFPAEDPAWADDLHKPFASQVTWDGKTFYKPNEDPAMKTARFMQHADAQVQGLVNAQSDGRDYRGPVHIKPHWYNNVGHGSTRLNFYNVGGNGYPSVDSSTGPNSEDQLRFGDDGRIHLARDYSKVLRIDSNGNAYIGDIPEDKSNLNGVFVYDPNSGGLMHLEDHKWLTEGSIANTPYVSAAGSPTDGLIDRQRWNFENTHGDKVQPPVPYPAYDTFLKNSTAGDPDTLRDFESKPDSVLPRQATHFVTTVPGAISNRDNLFLSYVDHIKPNEAKSVNDWLRDHNAAWLFRDGFCAVSIDANTLEVRTIGGTPVWHVHIDPATGKETYENVRHAPLTSNYRIGDDVWNRVKQNEERDRELESQT